VRLLSRRAVGTLRRNLSVGCRGSVGWRARRLCFRVCFFGEEPQRERGAADVLEVGEDVYR